MLMLMLTTASMVQRMTSRASKKDTSALPPQSWLQHACCFLKARDQTVRQIHMQVSIHAAVHASFVVL